jgi:hypothetical protein
MLINAHKIRNFLLQNLPSHWDGKQCILELKKADYHWRQMEWIGWYYEWKAKILLKKELGGNDGPVFGNVEFDYELDGVWDFKTHPSQSNDWTYLNDVEAVNECLMKKEHLGWVIAVGEATYDDSGEFKVWHDKLKGKMSYYEEERIRRGAPSRKRKVSFRLEDILIVEFGSIEEINESIQQGWLRNDMQRGQRNSGGTPRNAKYGLDIGSIHSKVL